MAGLSPSALRAGIMITTVLLFLLSGTRPHWPSLIALAAFILIAINPLIIYNISFQLSIVAVIGITIFLTRFYPNNLKQPLKYVVGIALVSLGAIIFTSPLVARYFHSLSLMGVLTNLFAVPYMGFIIFPLATLAAMFSLTSLPFAIFLWKIAGAVCIPLISIIRYLNEHSDAYILHLSPTTLEIIAFYLFILLAIYWNKIPYKKIALSTICAIGLLSQIGGLMPNKFEVNFFDVGQGDATLVRFSSGHNVLIDGGGLKSGDFDVGKRILAPALWHMGIRKIDMLILTHPHHDHYRGLAYIAESFDPKVLWTNGENAPDAEIEEWKEFMDRIKKTNIEIKVANSDTPPLLFDKGKITFLYPKPGLAPKLDPNDASLAMIAEENGKKILIAGDLMADGETILLASGKNIECDILKVSHHGSSTSSISEFLKASNPDLAVISVGKDNAYGMPNESVLKRFKSFGIKLKRTDVDGMVSFSP